ncbi:hypothetical protein EON63_10405 [archaeon]|nr:MAG: hypothetical protein EON63_10405 [archaeon]
MSIVLLLSARMLDVQPPLVGKFTKQQAMQVRFVDWHLLAPPAFLFYCQYCEIYQDGREHGVSH